GRRPSGRVADGALAVEAEQDVVPAPRTGRDESRPGPPRREPLVLRRRVALQFEAEIDPRDPEITAGPGAIEALLAVDDVGRRAPLETDAPVLCHAARNLFRGHHRRPGLRGCAHCPAPL